MDSSIIHFFFCLVAISIRLGHSQEYQTSDGDYVDCVEIRKQPAFEHQLLLNHKIQTSPSEIPKPVITVTSKFMTQQAFVGTVNCPNGTVPVRQDNPLVATHYNLKHEYVMRGTRASRKVFGTKATINVWKPKIEQGGDESSSSQLWISSGEQKNKNSNTIEVGWMVYPTLYRDNKPRLFIFWTSDTYATECYNLRCPGFIQTSSSIVLGGSISPISAFGGNQFELTMLVWRDRKNGNWWLSLGTNNTLVGYWPAEIFTSLGHTKKEVLVAWGGEIANSRAFGRHTATQMGSGRFAEEGFRNASYFRNLEIVDNNNCLQPVHDLITIVDDYKFYNIMNQLTDDWGIHFFYGGPGHSKANRPFLHSWFVYLCIVFLFISVISFFIKHFLLQL